MSFTAPSNDGGGTIDMYRSKCISDDGGVTEYGDSATDPITVSGLSAGHRYRCAVKAHNAVGWGVFSVYSPWVELDTDVPGKPTGVTVTENSGSEVEVAFTAPVDDGGLAITSYRVRCESSDGGELRMKEGGASPITVIRLTGTKSYRCSVKAMNSLGWGSYSKLSTSFTLATSVPARPSAVTATPQGATSAAVAFTAPEDGGAAIDNYRAKCVSSDGGTTRYADGASSPLTVTGLSAGKTYQCTVKAHNSLGWGSYSPLSPAFTTP